MSGSAGHWVSCPILATRPLACSWVSCAMRPFFLARSCLVNPFGGGGGGGGGGEGYMS